MDKKIEENDTKMKMKIQNRFENLEELFENLEKRLMKKLNDLEFNLSETKTDTKTRLNFLIDNFGIIKNVKKTDRKKIRTIEVLPNQVEIADDESGGEAQSRGKFSFEEENEEVEMEMDKNLILKK
jgi:hypothetical protein